MDRKKVFIPFFLIVLLSLSAGAQVAPDFSVFADSSLSACSCQTLERSLTIQNQGDFIQSFAMQSDTSLAPSAFVLAPGESQQVSQFIQVPCSFAGAQELTTTVSTDLNVRKSFAQTLDAKQCDIVGAQVAASPQEQCRCTTFEHTVSVVNDGPFIDTFRFSAKGATVAPQTAVLAPGERISVIVYTTPDCTQTGSDSTVLVSEALQNSQIERISLDYSIDASCIAAGKQLPPAPDYTPVLIALAPLPLVLVAIALVVLFSKRKKQPKWDRPAKDKKPSVYKWEKKLGVPAETDEVKQRKMLVVSFVIIAIIGLLTLATYLAVNPDVILGNETINVTEPVIPVENATGNQTGTALFTPQAGGLYGLVALIILLGILYFVAKKRQAGGELYESADVASAAKNVEKRAKEEKKQSTFNLKKYLRISGSAVLAIGALLLIVVIAGVLFFFWDALVFLAASFWLYGVFGLVVIAIIAGIVAALRDDAKEEPTARKASPKQKRQSGKRR